MSKLLFIRNIRGLDEPALRSIINNKNLPCGTIMFKSGGACATVDFMEPSTAEYALTQLNGNCFAVYTNKRSMTRFKLNYRHDASRSNSRCRTVQWFAQSNGEKSKVSQKIIFKRILGVVTLTMINAFYNYNE